MPARRWDRERQWQWRWRLGRGKEGRRGDSGKVERGVLYQQVVELKICTRVICHGYIKDQYGGGKLARDFLPDDFVHIKCSCIVSTHEGIIYWVISVPIVIMSHSF